MHGINGDKLSCLAHHGAFLCAEAPGIRYVDCWGKHEGKGKENIKTPPLRGRGARASYRNIYLCTQLPSRRKEEKFQAESEGQGVHCVQHNAIYAYVKMCPHGLCDRGHATVPQWRNIEGFHGIRRCDGVTAL